MDLILGSYLMILLIISALLYALLVAKWADYWGRNAILYFILSLLLSPIIASIILLITGKKDGGKNKKKCPRCAEYIQSDAIVCHHCGHEFELNQEGPGLVQIESTSINWGVIYVITALFILSGVLLRVYNQGGQDKYIKSNDRKENIVLEEKVTSVDKFDFTGIPDVDSNVVNGLAPIILRIVSMDSTRVRVVVISDEGESFDHTFQRLGEEATYKAFGQFSLRISKTRSVAIYLDNQLLPYLGPENTWVSRAIIKKQGIIDGMTILRKRN